jgi:hypothetical protein
MIKWLEVIKLRSAAKGSGVLKEFLLPTAEVAQRGLVEMKNYRHAALETDLSVHLHRESEGPEQTGSALGLRLAQALKEFGLVDHSVWIEEEECQ